MPINLGTARQDINFRIDNTSVATFWSAQELNYWINEALRDIARRTETLQFFATEIVAQPGQTKYPLELNCLRVYRVEFVPVISGSTPQTYPVLLSNPYALDQRWGTWQNMQRSYPSWACFWGTPPNLTMQCYPGPSQPGNWNIWYYGLPTVAVNDGDTLQIVEGWWDLVSKYVEYVAFRKDRDPRWQDSKDLYEADLEEMIDKTRFWHDQGNVITKAWEPNVMPYVGQEWM